MMANLSGLSLSDWGQVGTLLTTAGAFVVWGIATTRKPLREYIVNRHREIGRQAFEAEFRQLQGVRSAANRVEEKQDDMNRQIDAIFAETTRTAASCERVELSVTRLSESVAENFKTMAQEIGQLQGAVSARGLGPSAVGTLEPR